MHDGGDYYHRGTPYPASGDAPTGNLEPGAYYVVAGHVARLIRELLIEREGYLADLDERLDSERGIT